MPANPYKSPWFKPTPPKPEQPRLSDIVLNQRWREIEKYLLNDQIIYDHNGLLHIKPNIYVAKRSLKFRLKGTLDWSYYIPEQLAEAINNNTVQNYYELMLNDINSDSNIWMNAEHEQDLKLFYAKRAKIK